MSSTNARRRVLLGLAAAIAMVGYGQLWTRCKPTVFAGANSDFSCFYRAGKMVLAGDASKVYDLDAQRRYDVRLGTSAVDRHGHSFSLPFVFPPFALALYAPLACFPYRLAEFLCYLASAGMLLALPFALRTSFISNEKVLPAELLAPVFFVPAILALLQGQPSVLLLLLLAITFADLAEGKETRAGVILACASVKPQLVLPLLLALLVWRKWRTLAVFASTSIALLGVSVAIAGWRTTLCYPRAVLEFNHLAASLGGEHPDSMTNLRGFLYNLLPSQLPGTLSGKITIAISILLLLGLGLLLRRFSAISEIHCALLVVVTLLVSYHAYLHDDALLLLPVLWIGKYLHHSRWTLNRCALAAALLALYAVPVLPTSLAATAMQMFAAMAILAALLAAEISLQRRAESVIATPPLLDTPAFRL